LFLLYVVSRYQKGVYGKKRLHKVVYMTERDSDLKPFEFRKYHYGQYSESLDEIKDQLLSMGYLTASPLDTKTPAHEGNKFELADRDLGTYYSVLLEKINPKLKKKIDGTIKEYGYLDEPKLTEIAYGLPEFIEATFEGVILNEEMPDCLEVNGLDIDDIEELEISLNPRFINLVKRMDNAFEQGDFDPDKVKKVVDLV
jgi:uncharacterized protein YwgA